MSTCQPTNNAAGVPAAIGPYSQAMAGAGIVFLSGQLGLDPATGAMQDADFAAEARQVMRNLKALAQAAGGDLDRILKLTVYLADMDDFAEFNGIAMEFLAEPYPARAAFAVKALPKGARVEVEGVMLASDG